MKNYIKIANNPEYVNKIFDIRYELNANDIIKSSKNDIA